MLSIPPLMQVCVLAKMLRKRASSLTVLLRLLKAFGCAESG